MKAYTDIEQSKKLVEILPIESADMTYDWAVIDIVRDDLIDAIFEMIFRLHKHKML